MLGRSHSLLHEREISKVEVWRYLAADERGLTLIRVYLRSSAAKEICCLRLFVANLT
jgi:hypothetical protein